jgi:hypothetical protein
MKNITGREGTTGVRPGAWLLFPFFELIWVPGVEMESGNLRKFSHLRECLRDVGELP